MSAAADVELDPAAVRGLVARAGDPKRERWLEQVRRTGACRHPVRLRGVVRRGEKVVYSTAREPDGALMVRCGNRREACCPSCAHEYRGDMWQLVYAGLAGGRKGVPEQVAEHTQVFATLTAPSFGPVHTRRDDGRPCRCGKHHEPGDVELGEAVDPDAYDYDGAALWNWHAPGLWNRFTVELVRVLAAQAGLSERRWRELVRVAYAKVAEFQARGLVHFHVIVRLDGAADRATAPGVMVSPEELCDAIREAGARSSLAGDAGDGQTVELGFGEQLHTRVLAGAGAEDAGELCAEQVAAYLAKYSCKASHEQITSRDSEPDAWRDRGVPEQLVRMAYAVLHVSERQGLRGMAGWVHMLGFRGHFVTKSRGYSTNLGTLRADRAAYRAQQDHADEPVDDDGTMPVLSSWEFLGSGYLNPGDVLLAAGVEASLRAAREALLDLRRGPPPDGGPAG
jgi:hypothetical protein